MPPLGQASAADGKDEDEDEGEDEDEDEEMMSAVIPACSRDSSFSFVSMPVT